MWCNAVVFKVSGKRSGDKQRFYSLVLDLLGPGPWICRLSFCEADSPNQLKVKIRAEGYHYWMFRREPAHLGGVQSCSITGGDATAQQTHFVQRGSVVHLRQGDLRHHGVLGERAAAHEVEQALAFAGEAGGPVRHQAFTLREPGGDEIWLQGADEPPRTRRGATGNPLT